MRGLTAGTPNGRLAAAVLLLAWVSLVWAPVPGRTASQVAGTENPIAEGFWNVRTNGNDSTFGHGLTHRYVNGELRFLTLAFPDRLHEFRIADASIDGTITQTTGNWNLASTGALNNFNGIWFEQERNRLWITSAEDYTPTNHPARITTMTLGTNGTVSNVRTVHLNVPAKRVYGGCNAVPPALIARLGGPYVCGWGGYTSLVEQGGGASIGPTMYAIADPDSANSGGTLQARTILDAAPASQHRGVRRTIPLNYFDGGDPRSNPPTRPTTPPVASGHWLSPNDQGLGWMVWGDSYYNTGVWIGTTYAAVASLCQGACWYQSGTLAFDGRQFELHRWDGTSLGNDRLARPASMVDLNLPRDNSRVWKGNITAGNVSGATYDASTGRMYLIGFPFGPDDFTGRLYAFRFGGSPAPTPPGVPRDAVVSEWSPWTPASDWSACTSSIQRQTERRSRTVLVSAANGGNTPSLLEERVATRFCGTPRTLPRLQARLVASGFDRPVAIVQHPEDPKVQLVVEQGGRVRVLRNGQATSVDFVDLSNAVTAAGEMGLLSLALAPDFSASGRVFASFTDRSGNSVVARFNRAGGDPFLLDPQSRLDLRWPNGNRFITQPFTNHNGGQLGFGPDGYLYIGFGDGGGANDPLGMAQNPASLLGKMLRLDVSVANSDDRGYGIPASNPFVGVPGALPEVWAMGLRNPWRWSFDSPSVGGTGALTMADVGEDGWEEVNYEPAGRGGRNYGWPAREGRNNHLSSTGPAASLSHDPIWEYGHDVGRAIIGGLVYRGRNLGSAFSGRYFFADQASHRIWSLGLAVDPVTGEAVAGDLQEHTTDLSSGARSPVSFGVDSEGEILVVSHLGDIHRLEAIERTTRPQSGPPVGTARPR